ncbi:MAG: recombinase family protein [Phycisphaeraceae bacterium]
MPAKKPKHASQRNGSAHVASDQPAPNKQYIALARVSSREQEREGFSLDVQEQALTQWAQRHGGEVVELFRIAETASKTKERKTFKSMLAYARKHAHQLDGVLFFKVDRAARNLFDYVELERLEEERGLEVIYITQPTENTPAGRMMRRTLANMAAFYTEQMALDIQDGIKRRVQNGLFPNRAPYGYRNVRVDGRGLIEIDPRKGPRVRRIFDLYVNHGHTIDSLVEQLDREGVIYSDTQRRFSRSAVHRILKNRSYIGEIPHRGESVPGTHKPLVDRATFKKAQSLLRGIVYRSHELVFGSGLITCAHCGRAVSGERKTKKTKLGPKDYIYYFCTHHKKPDHPPTRVNEQQLDEQMLDLFRQIRIGDDKIRDWFLQALRARVQEGQRGNAEQLEELNRQLAFVRNQQDQLVNLRLLEEIESETFKRKSDELRDRSDEIKVKIEIADRSRAEQGEIAEKAFELSQTLEEKWVGSDYGAKRQILEIVCSNFSLDGVTLGYAVNKPFDALLDSGKWEESGEGGILCRGPSQLIISLYMLIIRVYNGITCNDSHILKAL